MKQPLNLIVFEDLFNKIKTGYYAKGDKLPTESEMQSIYGVSRAPIRQALGRLQSEGLIERRPGIGTVVIESNLSGPWPAMGGFSSNFSKRWDQLQVKTLDVSKVIPDKEVTNKLEIEPETPTVKVTRIRMEHGTPIFLLFNYYVDADIELIKGAGEILNMRAFASEVLSVDYAHVTEEISAIPADEATGYLLETDIGYPLLQIKRVSYDSDYKPVEYVHYFVKSEDWPYKITYSQDNDAIDL